MSRSIAIIVLALSATISCAHNPAQSATSYKPPTDDFQVFMDGSDYKGKTYRMYLFASAYDDLIGFDVNTSVFPLNTSEIIAIGRKQMLLIDDIDWKIAYIYLEKRFHDMPDGKKRVFWYFHIGFVNPNNQYCKMFVTPDGKLPDVVRIDAVRIN